MRMRAIRWTRGPERQKYGYCAATANRYGEDEGTSDPPEMSLIFLKVFLSIIYDVTTSP